mmetsp:Transcript_7619/g.19844  ORF Transcript_7619/g.19844 Transcript_7619/m.19844 type:complete len:138 (-) Transcript_7619:101-514(-)
MQVLRLVLAIVAVTEAVSRGKSGGRAGGGGFSRSRRTSMTRRSATATKEAPQQQAASTQPVYVVQQGGMGMGTTTALMGLSLLDSIAQEQRRAQMMRTQLEQAEKLGQNTGEIKALQAQLAAQEQKIAQMESQAKKE